MKQIARIFLCYLITIECAFGYDPQECYICENNGCVHPSTDDVKSCSDAVNSNNVDTSGKDFVNGALGGSDASQIYVSLKTNYTDYITKELNITNDTVAPWDKLTRWVNSEEV